MLYFNAIELTVGLCKCLTLIKYCTLTICLAKPLRVLSVSTLSSPPTFIVPQTLAVFFFFSFMLPNTYNVFIRKWMCYMTLRFLAMQQVQGSRLYPFSHPTPCQYFLDFFHLCPLCLFAQNTHNFMNLHFCPSYFHQFPFKNIHICLNLGCSSKSKSFETPSVDLLLISKCKTPQNLCYNQLPTHRPCTEHVILIIFFSSLIIYQVVIAQHISIYPFLPSASVPRKKAYLLYK